MPEKKFYMILKQVMDAPDGTYRLELVNEEYEWDGTIDELSQEFATKDYEEFIIVPNEHVHFFKVTPAYRTMRIK